MVSINKKLSRAVFVSDNFIFVLLLLKNQISRSA